MGRRVTIVGYVCVCASGSFFSNMAKKTYGSTQRYSLSYNVFFCKTASSRRYIQNSSGSHIGAPVGNFACPRRHPSIYPFT